MSGLAFVAALAAGVVYAQNRRPWIACAWFVGAAAIGAVVVLAGFA